MASISKVIIGGFKSIRDRTEIPIAPITFLFGPNSAGKSAVLGAVNALRVRIDEGSTKGNTSSFDRPPPTIASGAAYLGKERKEFADGEDEDQLFGDYPNVTLGVEIEDFPADIEPEGDFTSPVLCGRALYWALDGASVELEIQEFYWEDRFRDSCSQLGVDQVELLKFHTSGLTGALEMPSMLEFEIWRSEPYGPRLNLLGAVSINLGHPIWSLASIVDGPGNFDSRLGRDDAIRFDKYRLQLDGALKKLKNLALTTTSLFLKQLIIVDGDWLHLRTETGFLSAKSWMPASFYSAMQPSFADLWGRAGLNVELEEQNLSVIQETSEVLETLSCFGKLVLTSTADCLKVTAVDGDRGVLKPMDVTSQFPDFHINHLAASKFWTTSWGEKKHKFSFFSGPEANSYLALYAFWLGSSKAGNAAINPALLPSLEAREDFVNYVLKMGVFGAKRYEIKPAVWSITTKTLMCRDAQQQEYEGEDYEETDLKVQLFLEDQNGRKLDFSEVGSGISYVMPILASLHSAKTSWVAQPELHLHPAAQCEMGDVFLRGFNRGHYSVIETHSEHVLLRVLRRIRQTTKGVEMDADLKCPPEAVSVLHFDPQDDGSTNVRQLRVTRLGDFKDRWPNGFFEERGRELFDE